MNAACTLSLRTLKSGSRPRPAAVLARNPYRGGSESVFDRYNTIRIFFSQQAHAPRPKARPSLLPRTYLRIQPSLRFLERPDSLPFRFSYSRRWYSDRRSEDNATANHSPSQSDAESRLPKSPDSETHLHLNRLEQYPRFLRKLAASLPHLHRPTRDDFLKVASGFWQRTLIRFRWLSIRSFRKFNADDISAFVTWFLMSQTLWVLIYT